MEFALPERPTPPLNIENVPIAARIKTIQAFINKLEYNHTNQNYFNLCKARPYVTTTCLLLLSSHPCRHSTKDVTLPGNVKKTT